MSAAFYGWLAVSMAVFLSGAAALRRYVDQPVWSWVALALLLYSVGNLIMVRLMRESGMAIAISVSAVVQLVMANFVALALFGERPAPHQMAGIALGVVAVALISIPAGGR